MTRHPLRRPGYHLTPRRGWMNDPNGLIWHEGRYHAFFQHNPTGLDWGEVGWGHAVSRDLVTWEERPLALAATDEEYVFSGSIVPDPTNASELGHDGREPLVAAYTSHDRRTGAQRQSLAFSLDGGDTWTRYADNPVLDLGSTEFRDPKLQWYAPGGYWVMVVVLATDRVVQFYRSDDLRTWKHLSDFGPAGATDGVWECPDLVALPVDDDPADVRWVLVVSVQEGGPAGGSGMQYFLGSFDGVTFTAEDPARIRWVDHGPDYYAAVSFADAPDGSVHLGWLSNWAYAGRVPATEFRGSLTLPRRYLLRQRDGQTLLVQEPVAGSAWRPLAAPAEVEVDGVVDLGVSGARLRIRAVLYAASAERCGLQVRVGEDEVTVIGYEPVEHRLWVDRSASGWADPEGRFTGRCSAPLSGPPGRVEIELFLDDTSLEVFADGGATVLTQLVLSSPESIGVRAFADGGAAYIRALAVSCWEPGPGL